MDATTSAGHSSGGGSNSTSNGKRASGRGRRPARALKFQPAPLGLPPLVHFTAVTNNGPASPPPTTDNTQVRAINLMTEKLLEMFAQCNAAFRYDRRLNPRRVLTKPSRSLHNHGHDNERHDYILYVNDVIGNEEGRKYVILDLLGQGTFGQVVKCQNVGTRELVAVKVIKNQAAFFNQSMMEVTVLEMLNQRYDREDKHHIVRMRDTFVFRQHLCIVVELLSLNLYDLIKQNQYRGFSLTLCRLFLTQILDAMRVLKDARIIHCDLKPENILLRNLESPSIKVIDFGSACHEHQTLYTYIQSRFYRSPEVLLGLPYSAAIDMWSLGCIAAELFLGLPIFPGASNYDQLARIVSTLGVPPAHMLEVGKETLTYFERHPGAGPGGRAAYTLKTRDKYSADTGRMEPAPKQYFSSTQLEEIILGYPMRPRDMSPREREAETAHRKCFLDFVRGLLCLNPIERWSPLQASQHPFVTGKPFTGPFVPAPPVTGMVPIPSGGPSMAVAGAGTSHTHVPAAHTTGASGHARPRANTLSSLSLQEVPPQIQRLTAATKEKGGRLAAGVNPAERTEPIPELASLEPAGSYQPALPFESYVFRRGVGGGAGSVGGGGGSVEGLTSGSVSGTGSISSSMGRASGHGIDAGSGNGGIPGGGSTTAGKARAMAGAGERMTAYASNRRVSQPVTMMLAAAPGNGAGGVGTAAGMGRRAVAGADQTAIPHHHQNYPAHHYQYHHHLDGDIAPSSVPTVVWYGPELGATTAAVATAGNRDKRRGSLREETPSAAPAPNITSSSGGAGTLPTNAAGHVGGSYPRRASLPTIQVDASHPAHAQTTTPTGHSHRHRKPSAGSSKMSSSFVSEPFPMTLDGGGHSPGDLVIRGNNGGTSEKRSSQSSSTSMDALDEESEPEPGADDMKIDS